ncbi:MAG: hypothetical protein DRP68_01980 [Candidatus Omnitrophota bacterium]|nr:MAG: hypothetical protein DRP68_01980 [Candidatus Omnitrophota bacterium]RKY38666.1 MAG: hypothetical protein DRP72_01375 [Candidatus Omnitrophota bacterium]RKY45172.1 MAG: hypothetical protein DRP81_04545 [Candidatus Omnitrophota bacterium]
MKFYKKLASYFFSAKIYEMKRCLLIILFLIGCAQPPQIQEPSGFIQVKGSDTLVNAAQKLAEEFMKEYPYIFVAVTGGGSGVGIASLINKTTDIATASRRIKNKEKEIAKKWNVTPYEIIIGFDGVAVIVNKKNPIKKLTIKQLHDIYTGKIKNWNQLGEYNSSIVALSREVSSGTHIYFKERVVQLDNKKSKEEFSPNVLLLSSNQAIVEEVASNPQAIGYVGMGYLSSRVKALAIKDEGDYFLPIPQNVIEKKYPLSRPLFMYTDGEPTGIVKIFIDFVLSEKGQKQIEEVGFVPLRSRDVFQTPEN